MDNYIKLLQDHKVSHLVCATDQLYKTEELTKSGRQLTSTLTTLTVMFCRSHCVRVELH